MAERERKWQEPSSGGKNKRGEGGDLYCTTYCSDGIKDGRPGGGLVRSCCTAGWPLLHPLRPCCTAGCCELHRRPRRPVQCQLRLSGLGCTEIRWGPVQGLDTMRRPLAKGASVVCHRLPAPVPVPVRRPAHLPAPAPVWRSPGLVVPIRWGPCCPRGQQMHGPLVNAAATVPLTVRPERSTAQP